MHSQYHVSRGPKGAIISATAKIAIQMMRTAFEKLYIFSLHFSGLKKKNIRMLVI
jgi:hypothetical protein